MAGFNGYGFCVQVLQGWVQRLQGWVQELQGYADDCPQAKKNPAQGPGWVGAVCRHSSSFGQRLIPFSTSLPLTVRTRYTAKMPFTLVNRM